MPCLLLLLFVCATHAQLRERPESPFMEPWSRWRLPTTDEINNALRSLEGESEQISAAGITNNFFDVSGIQPFIGRVFSEADSAYSLQDVPEGTPSRKTPSPRPRWR